MFQSIKIESFTRIQEYWCDCSTWGTFTDRSLNFKLLLAVKKHRRFKIKLLQMRCGVGGKSYVLHTSEAIEQEQTTEIRKKEKKWNWLWRLWNNKEMHVNLEMCSASWHRGDALCGTLQIALKKQARVPEENISSSLFPFLELCLWYKWTLTRSYSVH